MSGEDDDVKELKRGVNEILLLLRGDGSDVKPGIVVRVDRLEQREKQRSNGFAVLWTGIIAVIVGAVDTIVRLFVAK